MADLKDVAGALGADVQALDAEATHESFLHKAAMLLVKGVVAIVETAARGAIVTGVPLQYQDDVLDLEKHAEAWLAQKLEGKKVTLTADQLVALHGDLADATKKAVASFVTPKIGATGGAFVEKIAHAIEDAAADAMPQEPHV